MMDAIRSGMTKSEAKFLRQIEESSMPEGYFVRNVGTLVIVGRANRSGAVAILAVIDDVTAKKGDVDGDGR